jgi:hypothetical protein
MCAKIICSECLKKQEKIDRLEEENRSLKAKLRYKEQLPKGQEGYFGSSTPSSKLPIKKNSQSKAGIPKNKGGAKPGHEGRGRKLLEKVDRVEVVNAPDNCPYCGSNELKNLGKRQRYVNNYVIKLERVMYQLERKRCNECNNTFQGKVPGVFDRNLLSNNLLSHVACEHYLEGITLGHLENQTTIGYGSLVNAMHRLGELLKDIPDRLIEEYKKAEVKHADETSWRTDGQNGYAWLFTTDHTAVYRFRKTRSAKVAHEVLGQKKLPGFLVVDRYGGYNKSPCKIQYCYAHLLRAVQDLEKEFPEKEEIRNFVSKTAALLSEAMNLRGLSILGKEYHLRAKRIKKAIIKIMNSPAEHAGIQNIQYIFNHYNHRLYHWVNNRNVPAENNFAERQLRPLVLARKNSFGSHSDEGARTREILMTVLRTLKLRSKENIKDVFKNLLDNMAYNPNVDVYGKFFPKVC